MRKISFLLATAILVSAAAAQAEDNFPAVKLMLCLKTAPREYTPIRGGEGFVISTYQILSKASLLESREFYLKHKDAIRVLVNVRHKNGSIKTLMAEVRGVDFDSDILIIEIIKAVNKK